VENCNGFAPAVYGHRWGLTEQERRNRSNDTKNCRHNCLTVFLYYCDNRAKIRKTPGNILFKNCRFDNIDAITCLTFGHVWCNNRSLNDVTFENCEFTNVFDTSKMQTPENEPVSMYFKNCKISPKDGCNDKPLIEVTFFNEINFENVTVEGFLEPKIVYSNDGKITVTNGTQINKEKLIKGE
jgi:hypothetical protein